MRILLGSASEGRKKIFSKYFSEFEIVTHTEDENKLIRKLGYYSSKPEFLSSFLAFKKAENIIQNTRIEDQDLVFTFDTVVFHSGIIKHKPRSKDEAKKWLLSYRNDFQEIYTGYCIYVGMEGIFINGFDRSTVFFKNVQESIIDDYINNNPVENWAGGIAIEIAGGMIDILEGDIESIIGVPMKVIKKELKKLRISIG